MKKQSYVIKPHLRKDLPVISHGKGIHLYDQEGKRYIDGCSGAVCASIGHGVEEIVQAMIDQAKKISFTYRSQFTSEAVESLAKRLSEWAPGDINWSFFVNSGSEATETAMKIAIQYWQEKGLNGKNKVISRWMSYHGITMGALSMSGHVLRRKRFIPLLEEFPVVSPPYCFRCPLAQTFPTCKLACAKELEIAITRIGEENIAAFIAESIIGAAGGAVVPPFGYYQEIREICTKHNILFIADEVMTGMGRTGANFGIDHWGVTPDIIALGKGMSAGYTPMAAAMVSDQIIEEIAGGSASIMSGHTYSANPQSAAVSLAVVEYMEKNQLVANARLIGSYLIKELTGLKQQFSLIGDVRGLGLMVGLELVKSKESLETFPLQLGITNRLIAKAMEKGLLVYPASGGLDGRAGDCVMITPPLNVSIEEIDQIISILEATIQELSIELIKEGILQA
ncbi:MAG TPA: aspartate aminotransferase family protein [Bacillota bacterium]|nr:aspartate aminotransferase family protein [Bacillota bacterium]